MKQVGTFGGGGDDDVEVVAVNKPPVPAVDNSKTTGDNDSSVKTATTSTMQALRPWSTVPTHLSAHVHKQQELSDSNANNHFNPSHVCVPHSVACWRRGPAKTTK